MIERAGWRYVAAVSLLMAACATTPLASPAPPPPTAPAPMLMQVPSQVAQGGLVMGTVPPGSEVELPANGSARGRRLLVSPSGRFVFGVGREQAGPIRLLIVPAGNTTTTEIEIAVLARTFPTEVVTGVPQDTVTPSPAIAARIEREQARVAAARDRDDDRDDFDVRFHWPVLGRISGEFGSTRVYNGLPGAPHSGMDIAADQGAPVHAPAAGIVSFADGDLYLTGGTLVIDHGHGLSSTFLHLSRIDVSVGDPVHQDQVVARVGKTGRATGPHLHWGMNWFEVRVDPHLLVNADDNPQPAP